MWPTLTSPYADGLLKLPYLTACRRMRAPLLRLAASLRAVADAVAAVLEDNAPLGAALGPLREVEASFAALSAAAREAFREGGVLTQNVLALDMVLSLLFTVCTRVRGCGSRPGSGVKGAGVQQLRRVARRAACVTLPLLPGRPQASTKPTAVRTTRRTSLDSSWQTAPTHLSPPTHPQVRRLYLLLPGALGQDQPGAAALVLAHFHSAAAWDFERMTQVSRWMMCGWVDGWVEVYMCGGGDGGRAWGRNRGWVVGGAVNLYSAGRVSQKWHRFAGV